ncbi:hypothetical protein [Conyzicola sp.]|uniref:hypothetical protein n=1 Tax=Conyzicola sp. TaxID=1969404 RepID=UPI003989FAF9
MTTATTGREPWWRVIVWGLVVVVMVTLFVLGETIVAAVFTGVVFNGADSGSTQLNLPAGGMALGIALVAVAVGVVVGRRDLPAKRGRPRGAVTLVLFIVFAAIACVSWAVAGVAIVVNGWPNLLDSPSGRPVTLDAWPAWVGAVVYLVLSAANAGLAVYLARRVRAAEAGTGRRREEPVSSGV